MIHCIECKWWGPKEVKDRTIQSSLPCLLKFEKAYQKSRLHGAVVNFYRLTLVTKSTKPNFGCVEGER